MGNVRRCVMRDERALMMQIVRSKDAQGSTEESPVNNGYDPITEAHLEGLRIRHVWKMFQKCDLDLTKVLFSCRVALSW